MLRLVREIWLQVSKFYPVRGIWYVPDIEAERMYCDVSRLAVGFCLQIDGYTMVDNKCCWLKKSDNVTHIYLVELVLKGVNLAVTWNIKRIELVTDNNTVHKWPKSNIHDDHLVKTTGVSEVLVLRRLAILSEIANECDIKILPRCDKMWHPILVTTKENLADRLTNVPKQWLRKDMCFVVADAVPVIDRTKKE